MECVDLPYTICPKVPLGRKVTRTSRKGKVNLISEVGSLDDPGVAIACVVFAVTSLLQLPKFVGRFHHGTESK